MPRQTNPKATDSVVTTSERLNLLDLIIPVHALSTLNRRRADSNDDYLAVAQQMVLDRLAEVDPVVMSRIPHNVHQAVVMTNPRGLTATERARRVENFFLAANWISGWNMVYVLVSSAQTVADVLAAGRLLEEDSTSFDEISALYFETKEEFKPAVPAELATRARQIMVNINRAIRGEAPITLAERVQQALDAKLRRQLADDQKKGIYRDVVGALEGALVAVRLLLEDDSVDDREYMDTFQPFTGSPVFMGMLEIVRERRSRLKDLNASQEAMEPASVTDEDTDTEIADS